MKQIIINLIVLIHKLIVYLMLFGFLLPQKYLYLHLIAWPAVYLHWQLNNDKCFLTELEYTLKDIEYDKIPKSKDDHDFPFMRRIFNDDLGLQLTDLQIHTYILKYLTIVWFVSLIRIMFYN